MSVRSLDRAIFRKLAKGGLNFWLRGGACKCLLDIWNKKKTRCIAVKIHLSHEMLKGDTKSSRRANVPSGLPPPQETLLEEFQYPIRTGKWVWLNRLTMYVKENPFLEVSGTYCLKFTHHDHLLWTMAMHTCYAFKTNHFLDFLRIPVAGRPPWLPSYSNCHTQSPTHCQSTTPHGLLYYPCHPPASHLHQYTLQNETGEPLTHVEIDYIHTYIMYTK